MGQLGHFEDILLDACDVVPVVTQHPCQRGLLQLGQLGRGKHAWVFIPEPEQDRQVKGKWDVFYLSYFHMMNKHLVRMLYGFYFTGFLKEILSEVLYP